MTARVIPISPVDRQAVDASLAGFAGLALHRQTPQQAREGLNARRAHRPDFEDAAVAITDETLSRPWGSMNVRRYRPRAVDPASTVIYCHGGGWVMGRPDDFDAACAALAAETGFALASPDYRLAPEHPFPAALDDVLALIDHEANRTSRPLGIAGESAGGGLAASAAMVCRDRGAAPLAGLLLFYPLTAYTAVAAPDAARDTPFLHAADLAWCWRHYLTSPHQRDVPYAAPGAGPFAGLPPTLVVYGDRDPVTLSASAFCERLRNGGVTVEEWICEGLPHAFSALSGRPAVRAVINEAAAWMKAVINGSGSR